MTYIKGASEILLPVIFLLFAITALRTKTDAFNAFSEGAKESLSIICDIFPSVFALMTAIGMLRSSGLLDFIISSVTPVFNFLGVPPEIVPSALLRPLSGSGSIALLSDILKSHNPDSLIGIMASVITGSTETTFYTIAVYFGACEVKNTGNAVKAALVADIVSISVSIIICKLLF